MTHACLDAFSGSLVLELDLGFDNQHLNKFRKLVFFFTQVTII
jgi:hypothetical protein